MMVSIVTLPKAGAGALFNSIAVTSGGALIDQRLSYNVWRTVQHVQKAGVASSSVMNTLLGYSSDKVKGVTISKGESKTFCDPIKNHASIFVAQTHYLPMFGGELEMVSNYVLPTSWASGRRPQHRSSTHIFSLKVWNLFFRVYN